MTEAETRQRQALERAVALANGQSALAAKIAERLGDKTKVKQAHVHHWLQTGRVPPMYCPTIEAITADLGDRVRCEELCEDVEWDVVRSSSAEEPATEEAGHG